MASSCEHHVTLLLAGGSVRRVCAPEEGARGLVGAPDDVQLALDHGQAQQVPQQRLVQVLSAPVHHHVQRPLHLRMQCTCSPLPQEPNIGRTMQGPRC